MGKHAYTENKFRTKVASYQGDMAKEIEIIEDLQKDKKMLTKKL